MHVCFIRFVFFFNHSWYSVTLFFVLKVLNNQPTVTTNQVINCIETLKTSADYVEYIYMCSYIYIYIYIYMSDVHHLKDAWQKLFYIFRRVGNCPPKSVNSCCEIGKVECEHWSVFLAGIYNTHPFVQSIFIRSFKTNVQT